MAKKIALRDKVRMHLMQQLQNGHLKLDKTINLARLSRELGISVTPIREALTQLEHVGIIKAEINRGFVIAKLTLAEARHLYQTIAELEALALSKSEFNTDDYNLLRTQLTALVNTHTINFRIKEHFEFHRLLTHKANPILLDILNNLRTRMLFYEQHYICKSAFYENVDNQNEAIIQAIEEDNLPTAELILKMNWMQILDHLSIEMAKNNPVIDAEEVTATPEHTIV